MKLLPAKIPLFLLVVLLFSCNPVKRVEDGEHLLIKNTLYVDSVKTKDRKVESQYTQQPNATLPLIKYPLRLHIYNQAKSKPDSLFYEWLDKKPKREKRMVNFFSKKQTERIGRTYVNWQALKEDVGEAPAVIEDEKIKKSSDRLRAWYWNQGWFNTEVSHKVDTLPKKKAEVNYYVTKNKPYFLDSLSVKINSKAADSIYQVHQNETLLKEGRQFNSENFDKERKRLTGLFRNNGLYHFDQENITFNIDTLNTDHKALAETVITDREVTEDDTTYTTPFYVHKINGVNIFTNYIKEKELLPITDSTHYKDYKIYSSGKSKYKPKALTDAVFIKKGRVYKDVHRSWTYSRVNDLRIFDYPDIKYIKDPEDSTGLIANVFLKPKKKFGVTYDLDVSRSNIQDFGIRVGGSLLSRNIFRGLETLEFGVRAGIGSSTDASVTTQNRFFNISEVGGDLKLSVPRIIFPFNIENIIPKRMSPFTEFSIGTSFQHNIGLDKQNLTGKYSYAWKPSRKRDFRLNLVDLQYVSNLNPNNYFNVYRNSFDRINSIAQNHVENIDPDYFENDNPVLSPNPKLTNPDGANNLIKDIKNGEDFGMDSEERKEASTLIERKDRLTENNLIFGSSFNFVQNSRDNIYDQEFSQFRINFEAVGNSLYLLSNVFDLKKADDGSHHITGVRFSQYLKAEVDFIKHWDFGRKNILAIKAMAGAAIPYGNANSIPFVRSFFAGGSNDNRGWRPYDLGPGSSGGPNEFNEANMKIALNAEYRFNLFGKLNSAVFIDAGNIWNVLDNVTDERSRMSKITDLKEIAVGSGIGFRYDFEYFIIRLDLGLKTYDPAYNKRKWFHNYNLAHSVINVGINYPF